MEHIIYRPHCSKCGGIIYEKVAYTKIIEEISHNLLQERSEVMVQPYKCSYCGAQFDCIKIPVPEELPIQYLNNMGEEIKDIIEDKENKYKN